MLDESAKLGRTLVHLQRIGRNWTEWAVPRSEMAYQYLRQRNWSVAFINMALWIGDVIVETSPTPWVWWWDVSHLEWYLRIGWCSHTAWSHQAAADSRHPLFASLLWLFSLLLWKRRSWAKSNVFKHSWVLNSTLKAKGEVNYPTWKAHPSAKILYTSQKRIWYDRKIVNMWKWVWNNEIL